MNLNENCDYPTGLWLITDNGLINDYILGFISDYGFIYECGLGLISDWLMFTDWLMITFKAWLWID